MPKQVRHDTLAEVKSIGIKYCGGCNPFYERVEIVHRAQSKFNHQLHFVRHDQPDIDVMILMSGCQRACAAQDLHQTVPRYSVTGKNDFEAMMGWLQSLTAKGDP
jgi:hypothetical protein